MLYNDMFPQRRISRELILIYAFSAHIHQSIFRPFVSPVNL